MNNEKMMFWAMALIALVVIAVYVSKQYENFEASLSAGPIKLNLKASNGTTTLVNMPFAVEALAAKL
jgi:cell division protein FtsL